MIPHLRCDYTIQSGEHHLIDYYPVIYVHAGIMKNQNQKNGKSLAKVTLEKKNTPGRYRVIWNQLIYISTTELQELKELDRLIGCLPSN